MAVHVEHVEVGWFEQEEHVVEQNSDEQIVAILELIVGVTGFIFSVIAEDSIVAVIEVD